MDEYVKCKIDGCETKINWNGGYCYPPIVNEAEYKYCMKHKHELLKTKKIKGQYFYVKK